MRERPAPAGPRSCCRRPRRERTTEAEALGKRRSHAIGIRVTRTGLLGGSFNPAHRGHRRVSAAAIRALGLDELWWLVSPGNPLKPAEGMAPLPARLASARRLARRPARPGHGDRSGARHPIHRRYAGGAAPSLPRPKLHLADGRGQSCPVPPLAALAQDRRGRFRLRSFRVRDMMAPPTRLARWAGCGASSNPRTRLGTGRSGERRRSCS